MDNCGTLLLPNMACNPGNSRPYIFEITGIIVEKRGIYSGFE